MSEKIENLQTNVQRMKEERTKLNDKFLKLE